MDDDYNGFDKHSDHALNQLLDAKMDIMGQTIVQGVRTAFDGASDKVVEEIKQLRRDLVPAATSAGRIDVKVIMPIIYTLCGLLGALIIWFTGVQPMIPGAPAHAKSVDAGR